MRDLGLLGSISAGSAISVLITCRNGNIPEQDKARAARPFRRARVSRARASNGLGLVVIQGRLAALAVLLLVWATGLRSFSIGSPRC